MLREHTERCEVMDTQAAAVWRGPATDRPMYGLTNTHCSLSLSAFGLGMNGPRICFFLEVFAGRNQKLSFVDQLLERTAG